MMVSSEERTMNESTRVLKLRRQIIDIIEDQITDEGRSKLRAIGFYREKG